MKTIKESINSKEYKKLIIYTRGREDIRPNTATDCGDLCGCEEGEGGVQFEERFVRVTEIFSTVFILSQKYWKVKSFTSKAS